MGHLPLKWGRGPEGPTDLLFLLTCDKHRERTYDGQSVAPAFLPSSVQLRDGFEREASPSSAPSPLQVRSLRV